MNMAIVAAVSASEDTAIVEWVSATEQGRPEAIFESPVWAIAWIVVILLLYVAIRQASTLQ